MRKATRYDKKLVVSILTTTFETNPGINWMFRETGDHGRKLKRMSEYVFIKGLLHDGIYISSNEKGVAVCYKFNTRVFSVTELWYSIRFALYSIGIFRISRVLKRESYRKGIRPSDGEYLYFWFFGVLPHGERAAFELKNELFSIASGCRLPIYLETTLERNRDIYERYGFRTYHYWQEKDENIRFWFMKKPF